ncbi:Hsp20/alpha crystallin family protein [Advenella sp. FME57]|uniref:Hsp20/alpha crystallin family protein n=1 Tax=Advenella sp. FME57 TaxID=2742604 RepID=UPI00186825DF|nr:Hsp20/alpha crystallin family protein [Advenella sp. FME57]
MDKSLMQLAQFVELSQLSPWRSIDDFYPGTILRSELGNRGIQPRITIDILENEKKYTIKLAIKGIKKRDLKVVVEGNKITIVAAEIRESEEQTDATALRRECCFDHQSRSFSLAHEIEDSNAFAKYEDGVLELILPKKQVKIETACLLSSDKRSRIIHDLFTFNPTEP